MGLLELKKMIEEIQNEELYELKRIIDELRNEVERLKGEKCKHKWEVIGYAGFKEEGSRAYLYQCKLCKAVKFDMV